MSFLIIAVIFYGSTQYDPTPKVKDIQLKDNIDIESIIGEGVDN